jgi:hypothetical protein
MGAASAGSPAQMSNGAELRVGWWLELLPVDPPPARPGLVLVGRILECKDDGRLTLELPGDFDLPGLRMYFHSMGGGLLRDSERGHEFRLGRMASELP